METSTKIDADLVKKISEALTPSGYRILIADEPQGEVSKGGIYIPESILDQQRGVCMFGTVVALGDLCYSREDMNAFDDWCSPGDIVTFSKYSGVRFRVHGHPIRILNDDEIQAVIKDKESVEW